MTKETIRLRIGGYQGANSVLTAGLELFAGQVREAVDDAVAIEVVNDVTAQGMTAQSLFDGIESGDFDVGYMNSSYLTARVPQLAVIDIPFSQSDRYAAYTALDGAAGRMLTTAIEGDTGYRVLGFWDNGFRHLTNRRRPVHGPEDCPGIVVRTLNNAIYQETMSAMGLEPVVTDVRELREAVASGRVDAQENPLTNAVVFEFYHHHPHLSMTAHFFGVALLLANAAWFRSLPEDVAVAVRQAAATSTAQQRKLAAQQDIDALELLREKGVSIVTQDRVDREAFRKACRGIVERELAKLDPALTAAYLDASRQA